MSVVDELVTVLGIDLDASALAKLHALQSGMEKLEKWAVKATVAVAAATTTFAYWLNAVSKNSEGLIRLSDMTGVSTDEIQKLSYGVEQLGGNSEALKGDILNLQKTMTSPIPGQFNENLLMLGVATKEAGGGVRKVEDVLGDLSGRFGKMNSQQALQWGTKLGLSQDTIRLLQQGREGVEKLKKQAEALGGIIPNDALRNSIKFNQGLKDIWFSIKGITTQLGLSFLPTLTKVIDKLRDWLTTNREWLKLKLTETIDGISAGFERAWGVITKIVSVVYDYGKKIFDSMGFTMSLKDAMEGFVTGALIGLAALAIAWMVSFWPVVAITAAVVALGLVIEDIIQYFSGGQSVIGSFFDAFQEKFPAIYDFLSWLANIIGTVLVAYFKSLWDIVSKVTTLLVDMWKIIAKVAEFGLEKLGFGKDKSKKTAGKKSDTDFLESINAVTRERTYKQPASSSNASTVNNNQKVSINVQGTSDSKQTAQLVHDELSSAQIGSPGQFAPVTG